MAELVNGSCASGKRKFVPGREATPGSPSIPIDPILLEESMRQGKLGSDTDSDSNVSCYVLELTQGAFFIFTCLLSLSHHVTNYPSISIT